MICRKTNTNEWEKMLCVGRSVSIIGF